MRTRVLLLALGVLILPGCTSWQPGRLGDGPVPRTMQVILRDRSSHQLEDLRLVGDSLLMGRDFYGDTLSIPVRDVVAIRTRRFDLAKTLTLAGVSVGLGIPALLGLAWAVVMVLPGPYT